MSFELEQAHRRLEHLYEISKLLASFEDVQHSFDPVVAIAARTLPLHSVVLIEKDDGHTQMIVWSSEGRDSEQMRSVKKHVKAAYSYLIGAPTESLEVSEQQGLTPLPRPASIAETLSEKLIVIPLVVANRPPFGALQLEGTRPLDKTDLMFVNAIANQLAIALDRDRAWRRDITRREHAEAGQSRAEARGAAADQERFIAEGLSEKFEALAAENSRLYGQARRAVRVREQVLAIVSHDLKNPLQTILLTARILGKSAFLPQRPEGLSEVRERIERAAKRMQRLIEDLLDFASIEEGRLAITRQLQDSGSMLSETIANFESVAQEKRLQLTANAGPPSQPIYCDRDRIMQVLANLIGNATKAAAEGGHVNLRLEDRGTEILFTVSDDGPGLSAEDAKHLFERYWRSGEAPYKGTGLGLSIARGIITAHDGKIWAESELGHGATFYFTIPAGNGAGALAAKAHSSP